MIRKRRTRRYGYKNKGKFLNQLVGYIDMRTAPLHVKAFIEKKMKNERGEISPQKVAKLSKEEIYRNFPFPVFLSKDYGKSILIVRKLDELSKKLDKKYGNKFVCIQLVGSRSKGYAKSTSDMEYNIITNKASTKEQLEMCNKLVDEMENIGMKAVTPEMGVEWVDKYPGKNIEELGEHAVFAGNFTTDITSVEDWARHRAPHSGIGGLFKRMNIGNKKKIFETKKQMLKFIEEGPKPVPKGEWDPWHPVTASAENFWNFTFARKKGGLFLGQIDKRKIKGVDVEKVSKERRKMFYLPNWKTMKKQYLEKRKS